MHKLALLVSLIPLAILDAQEVRLSGTVSSGGQPVSGAIVTVAGLGLKDTTGADGLYSIVRNASGVRDRSSGSVVQDGRFLSVMLDQSAPFTLEVLDAGGTLVRREHNPLAAAGQHRIDLVGNTPVRGILLVRLTIGDRTRSFRVACLDGRIVASTETTNQDIAQFPALSRIAALPDTLRVTATGYDSRSIPLSIYDQTLDVLLTATATCNPSQKLPDPVTVNIANSGAPSTGSHQVVVETDVGIPDATIYRPKDLAPGKNFPILVWGNGACSRNGTELKEFLMEIASHGYLVVVDGTPNGSGGRDQGSGFTTLGGYLLNPMNWIIRQSAQPCSRFYRSLDTTKLASFGFSCGGLMAYGASFDPRMSTVIIMNSGMLGADPNSLAKVHTPIAYVLGGSTDIAFENGSRDYKNMNTQPTILANRPVGHGGTYYNDNGGEWATIAVAWFDWWLKGDATAKAKFYPATCGFCASPWTFESKRLP